MKKYYIYKTTNLINRKQYIGQHYGELNDDYLGSGTILKKAIEKYGKENFKKEVLYISQDEEENNKKEKEFIQMFNATQNPLFYNIHEGGSGGNTIKGYNEEQLKALKEKCRERMLGENNPKFGVKLSDETKEKIRQNRNTSYMQTEEYKKAMSQAVSKEKNGMYGKHHSEESKKKMSENRKGLTAGEKNPMYGKHHSEETKKKISEKAKTRNISNENNPNSKIVKLYLDKEHLFLKYTFSTVKEALIFVGVSPKNYSGVNRAIKNNRPYKDYYWEII